MKILAVGDVTSPAGVKHLCERLWGIRRKYGIDLCIVNGENASVVAGISRDSAKELLRSGADVITGGNHTMQNYQAYSALDEIEELLRPINYGEGVVGHGYTVVDNGQVRVLVINALGNVHIEPTLNSPYTYIDTLLEKMAGKYDVAVLDIHAEATGEKLALAYNYDGRISVVFGTHTHVPTSDLTVLPEGTGYVSDLGMCGESGGILGMDVQQVIRKMKLRMPGKLKEATGEVVADAVIFELDGAICKAIKRIKF